MARKKAFEKNEVLQKAMETFWCKGYEATSIQDLVEAMGINRGSLYDTFKDKHALFTEALTLYDETVVTEAIAGIEAASSGKESIIKYFEDLAANALTDTQRRGCFLTNAAVELSGSDPELAQRIAQNFQRLEEAFYGALLRSQQQGKLQYSGNLRSLARFCVSMLQGLRVTCKVNPSPEVLQDVVTVMTAVLS